MASGRASTTASQPWAPTAYGPSAYRRSASPNNTRTLIEHYNGSTVTVESSPNVGSGSDGLLAIGGETILHAVGDIGAGSDNKTLAMICTTC